MIVHFPLYLSNRSISECLKHLCSVIGNNRSELEGQGGARLQTPACGPQLVTGGGAGQRNVGSLDSPCPSDSKLLERKICKDTVPSLLAPVHVAQQCREVQGTGAAGLGGWLQAELVPALPLCTLEANWIPLRFTVQEVKAAAESAFSGIAQAR